MNRTYPQRIMISLLVLLLSKFAFAQSPATVFKWPEGNDAALSLSFDDGYPSHIDIGLPMFAHNGIRVTFFPIPSYVERRLSGWRTAVAHHHEIGNHTLNHPCSGNFDWAREKALENYTLGKMYDELKQGNQRIKELLGVIPETFAYPCGQTFVGRGLDTRSYVPLVSELFVAGRGWLGEVANEPNYVDLAQLTGISMDGKNAEEILSPVKIARQRHQWVILAGHVIGKGSDSTQAIALESLLKYIRDPANRLWVAPVGTIAKYLRDNRAAASKQQSANNLISRNPSAKLATASPANAAQHK